MNRVFFPLICVIILFSITIGCSQKQSLHGTITFSDDGSPVPTGAIFFTTPTFEAMGAIKKDGTYTVSSTGNNDGIPKGQTYAVTITADEVEQILNKDGTVKTPASAVIKVKANTYVSINGTTTLHTAKKDIDVLNVTGTIELWQAATAKKAATAKQPLTLSP